MVIPDQLTCLLRNLYAGQVATVRTGHGATGSKLGKEYVKAVYCYPAYLAYMRSSVVFNHPVMSSFLWSHELQYSRPLCPLPSPEICPSSCPLPQWCRPAILSSDALFSFCLQSFPASASFPMSQLFISGDQLQLQHQSFQWVVRVDFF